MTPEEKYLKAASKWLNEGERIPVRESFTLHSPVVTRVVNGCRLVVHVAKGGDRSYLVGVKKDGSEILL